MSKLKLIIPLFLLGIFMISTFSVVADNGGDSNSTDSNSTDSGTSQQRESADQNQVQVQSDLSSKQIQIESSNNYNGSNTHIEVELEANDGVRISFSYSGEVNHTESELQIHLQARQLVEFINNNTAVPGFDPNDTVLNTIDLRNLNYTLSVSNTTVGNNTLWNIDAVAPLGASGTIDFNFQISSGFAAITGNNTLAPNALKWTLIISGYQYSSPNSELALQMLMSSGDHNNGFSSDHIQNQTEDHQDGLAKDKESQVSFGNGTSTGFYSWADNYTVDGVSQAVVTSPSVTVDKEDSTQNQMYFSFVQGKTITWDPKVGVDRATTFAYDVANPVVPLAVSTFTSTPAGSKSSPGFEMLAVVLSIGTIAIISKRKFKN